jgi:hypothetical protein
MFHLLFDCLSFFFSSALESQLRSNINTNSFHTMDAATGQVAKAAMLVYDRWEREWVTRLQKADKSMTWDAWLFKFVQHAERFRSCSTTYLGATYLWTDEPSV